MREHKLRFGLLPAILTIASVSFIGCMNDDYDLDKIDKTIGIGGDSIVIPTNSTEEIKLEDILDLKSNGSVKLDADDNYIFQLAGSDVTPAHPKTDPVRLRATATTVNCVLPLQTGRRRSINVSGESQRQLLFEYHGSSDVVKSIRNAKVDPLTMTLQVEFPSGLAQSMPEIGELTINLPGYLDISSATVNQTDARISYSQTDNGLQLKVTDIKTAQALKITLHTETLSFEGRGTEFGGLAINTAQGTIDMEGWVSLSVNADLISLPADLNSTTIKVGVSFSDSYLTIREATGKFSPSIQLNNLGSVNVTGVPDFLSDGNVVVDLDNPQILLTIDNDLDLKATIDGTVIATKDGSETARIQLPVMNIGSNGRTVICICRHATNELVATYGAENVYEQSDLSTLIERIPDKVTISHVNALADDQTEATYTFGKTYNVIPSYEVTAPLSFAQKTVIVYKDSLDDWNDKLEDLELADGAYLEVTGTVENRVPLYLTVDAYAIDLEGHAISNDQLAIDIPSKVIASADGTTAQTSGIKVKVSEKQKGALKKMDGIVFRISGSAALEGYDTVTGITLNARDHTIRIKDIRVKMMGKVIGDFN